MTAEDDDTAAYLRGKLAMHGVTGDSDIATVCDLLTVLLVDGVPGEQLEKLRRSIDRQAWRIQPPTAEQWGRSARQQRQRANLDRVMGDDGTGPRHGTPATGWGSPPRKPAPPSRVLAAPPHQP